MKFGIIGAMGKMGQSIARLSPSLESLTLTTAAERDDHPELGRPYGSLINMEGFDMPLVSLGELDNSDIQGLIDFSSPASTLITLEKAQQKAIPVVIGTTGFDQNQMDQIQTASQKIPILLSSNMSLGVNLLFWLVKQTSHVLRRYDFDPEIMEIHHNQKKDAPSGTAKTLEEIILGEFGWNANSLRHGRSGIIGKRTTEELGSHALRGGNVVGEHTVYFFGDGERIELTHRAGNRNIFASGALRSLIFLSSQKPGLYNMEDVLSLEGA